MLPPSFLDVIKGALNPVHAYHSMGAKVGVGMTAGGGVTAIGSPAMLEILGATVDEWKVYGIIAGIVTAVAGVIVQIVFKWLERRDKSRHYSGVDRRG